MKIEINISDRFVNKIRLLVSSKVLLIFGLSVMLLTGAVVIAATFSIPNTFTSGTVISSSEVNENFSAIATRLNSGSSMGFRVTHSSGSQSFPDMTGVKVNWETADFDTTSGAVNLTNDTVTPTTAGTYLLHASLKFNNIPDTGKVSVNILRNGAVIASVDNTTGRTGAVTVSVTTIATANGSSDYFEVHGYQKTGGSYSLIAADEGNYFTGSLIK